MIFAAEQLRDLIDLAVLLSLPGVLVLAWLVGRLLGVRRSWTTTTVLSGVIGWVGGVALSLAIASQRKDMSEGFTRNVWLFSTVGVMSASVWIELLATRRCTSSSATSACPAASCSSCGSSSRSCTTA